MCGADSRLLLLVLSLTLAACAGVSRRPAAVAARTAPTVAQTKPATNPASPLPTRAQKSVPAPTPKSAAPVAVAPKPAPAPVYKDPRDRFSAAVQLLEKNQFKDAEVLLDELVKTNPNYSGPLTNLGIVYYKTSRRDLALAMFGRAAVANPRNAVAYNWLGILYRENGDYTRAEQAYLRALQTNDSYAAAHLNLGILYDQYLKKPALALEHYKRYGRLERSDELRVAAWIAALEPPKKPESNR